MCSNPYANCCFYIDGRRRRQAFADGLTYGDLFSNYPSGLRVREDVAKSVSFLAKLIFKIGFDCITIPSIHFDFPRPYLSL